jgi:hypothetical protein
MPIFELDDGRTRPVHPLQPRAGTFVAEVRALLAGQLGAVVGEALFPVRSKASLPEHADAPELLALEGSGRPVVIEATQVLDDDALIAALRHTGIAGRLTGTDLARAYHPEPTRFATDFAAFRARVPFATTSTRRDGARLILLCAEVAPEATDTLAALCRLGSSVTVLQVGVIRGADDRRWLEVAPRAPYEAERRSVEPTGLRLVRTSAPTAVAPAPAPVVAAVAPPVRAPVSRRDARTAGPALPPAPPPVAVAAPMSLVVPPEPLVVPPPPLVVPPPPMAPSTPVDRSGHALPDLAVLAKSRRAVTLLVWARERRGQRFEAMLRGDGLLQLPDGAVFADPDDAAAHAAGGDRLVDGWRAWRLGEGGPTLAQAAGR